VHYFNNFDLIVSLDFTSMDFADLCYSNCYHFSLFTILYFMLTLNYLPFQYLIMLITIYLFHLPLNNNCLDHFEEFTVNKFSRIPYSWLSFQMIISFGFLNWLIGWTMMFDFYKNFQMPNMIYFFAYNYCSISSFTFEMIHL